jgi:Nif-specific regulatory protein
VFKIIVEDGSSSGLTFIAPSNLRDGMIFTVGRDAESDIVLDVDHVSAAHGEFVSHQGGLFYRDMRSTNGTVLERDSNTNSLGEEFGWAARLEDGDSLLMGDRKASLRLRVELEGLEGVSSAMGPDGDDAGEPAVLALSRLEEVRQLEGRFEADPLRTARLYQAVKLISGSLDLKDVCKAACAAIFSLLPTATNISVLLDQRRADPTGGAALRRDFVPYFSVDREGAVVQGERASRHVVRHVLDEKAGIVICDTTDINPSQSIVRAKIRSLIGVPLAVGDRIVGILQVDNRLSHGLFNQDNVDELIVVASQIALSLENARLFQRVKVAEERLQRENRFLRTQEGREFRDIIGRSPAMLRVFELVDRVVDTSATVLITGETGTGKELIARAIHERSNRKDKLFVAQNCSALPESLLESELFGHKKGAFTGAVADKKGLFEIAHQGTMFLDEVGEMDPVLQSKLLRVLQESEIRPVGAMYPRKIDSRVIAATNRKLEEEVASGKFREDLYYRLNVFPIHLPALRDRNEDIPALAEHYLEKYCREFNRPHMQLSPEAIGLLQSYRWPGNIRELQNEVQRIVIHGVPGDLVMAEHLADRIGRAANLVERANPSAGGLKSMMAEVERWILVQALRDHDNNKTRTAKTLQITREGLHKKLSRFGL